MCGANTIQLEAAKQCGVEVADLWQRGMLVGYIAVSLILSVFLERLSMWNMLNCTEQVQIQQCKTHA